MAVGKQGILGCGLILLVLLGGSCKPTNPYYYMKRAEEEYKRGDYERAMQFYQEAAQRKPDLAEAYYGMGLVFYQQRQIDRAIDMFRKAREIKPDLAEAYYQEALIYQLMGPRRMADAIPLYEKALQYRPQFREARLNLGLIYEKLGGFAQALEIYQKGLELAPDDPEFQAAVDRVKERISPQIPQPEAPPPEKEANRRPSDGQDVS